MKHNDILSECYLDSTLIATLMDAQVNHKSCCNEVAREMEKGRYKDKFAVGIIDNDKKQNPYTASFVEIGRTDNLTFLKHPEKHHYLVKVGKPHKAMETFILANVSVLGLKMEDFGLPSNIEELIEITKDSITTQKDPRLLHLFKSLMFSPEIEILKNVLDYLVQNKYNVDISDITSMVS